MPVPNVSYRVEIAWTSNWRTPAAARVWTDVSAYVELQDGIKIDHGRSDEVSAADANTLALTLDNKDGRFTWGNAASPYFPNVRIGKPIRVTATAGGVDYFRFTGLVNEWPVEWPGESASFATASITASSRLSRLGLNSPLVNLLDQTIEGTAPDLYWPITEPSGTVAKEVEGRASSLYGSTLSAFGTGEGDELEAFPLDGRPVVKVSRGGVTVDGVVVSPGLRATFSPPVTIDGSITFGLFVKMIPPSPLVTSSDFFGFLPSDGTGGVGMAYDRPEYSIHPSGLDGVHHLAFTREQTSPTTFTLTNYLDGEVIRTTSGTAAPYTSLVSLVLPSPREDSGPLLYGRFAMWKRVLTATELAEIANVGLGLAGETTDERIQHLASWAHIPSAEVVTTPSPVALTAIPVSGGKVEELMRSAETAEAGVLYDSREGHLVLKPRAARYDAPIGLTIAMTTDRVCGYAPRVDRQNLANVGKGRTSEGEEVTFTDEASREEYGDAAYDVETTAQDPDEALQLVAWRVYGNSQPRPRVPAPRLKVIDWLGSSDLPNLLALDVGSKLRLTNAPAQAPTAASADYFVEGYSEEIGPGLWDISLNLSPVTLEDSVLILDDPVRGVLDSSYVLAL